MEETIQKIQEYVATYGLNILAAIAIFIIGKWLAGAISRGVEKMLGKTKTDPTLCKFAANLVKIALMAFVFIAVLSKLGIQTASFIAVLGAAGLAVGMALQGSLSNFAAGVMLLIFRPFKVGDFIDAGGVAGTVKEIAIFNTIVHTGDNVKVIVPNGQISGGTIKNFSANDTRRIDLIAGVAYGDDIKKVKECLLNIVTSEPTVLKDPAPLVAVSELADSSVNFVVRPWVKASDYWPTRFSLTERIKLELEAAGFNIPFPQQDIHIQALPQELAAAVKA